MKPTFATNGATRTPRITVGHSGRQHAYRLAAALQGLGYLKHFVTSSYYSPERFPDRLLARSVRLDRWLRRRHLDSLDGRRVVRRWDLELPELMCRAVLGIDRLSAFMIALRDARFDLWSARRWAIQGDIYWGFQGSCLKSLRAAREAGLLAVAEFAANHVTSVLRILTQEAERHPEWASTLGGLRQPDWYTRRLEQEPHEADYCVVASSFARNSLLEVGVPETRIKLLPLGADLSRFAEAPRTTDGTFRILFAGKIGQSKGIKYLLEAVKRIRSTAIELVLAGPVLGGPGLLAPYAGLFTCLGSLDQQRLADEMRRSHVLVLPSVLDGFGLVIPEAMATGMPVIASTHSAGPDIIEDGVDGFVLEPDDVEGLARKLDWMASHRQRTCDMGREAVQKAHTFSWEAHERRLAELVRQVWNQKCLIGSAS